jgi:hypothetical protein
LLSLAGAGNLGDTHLGGKVGLLIEKGVGIHPTPFFFYVSRRSGVSFDFAQAFDSELRLEETVRTFS